MSRTTRPLPHDAQRGTAKNRSDIPGFLTWAKRLLTSGATYQSFTDKICGAVKNIEFFNNPAKMPVGNPAFWVRSQSVSPISCPHFCFPPGGKMTAFRCQDQCRRGCQKTQDEFFNTHFFFQDMILPSTDSVTTCHGRNFPLCCKASLTARSSPPQQGTSIRMTVTSAISFSRRMAVNFSV